MLGKWAVETAKLPSYGGTGEVWFFLRIFWGKLWWCICFDLRIEGALSAVRILASVEAAKIFLGACGAKGKSLPDCHFRSFSGAGDVSRAPKNIKRRAAPCAGRARAVRGPCAGLGASKHAVHGGRCPLWVQNSCVRWPVVLTRIECAMHCVLGLCMGCA